MSQSSAPRIVNIERPISVVLTTVVLPAIVSPLADGDPSCPRQWLSGCLA